MGEVYFAWKKIQSNLRDTYSLVDATRKISLGDYDVDLNIGSNMETRILAESISEMSQKIESVLCKNNDLLRSEKNLNKQKNRLISIIAHDLRGPFSGLMITSELLAKELSSLDPEKVQHLLVRMNSTIISIFDLLEDLLSWANSENDYNEIKVEGLNLNQLVSDLYSLFEETANGKDIELTNEIPVDLILYSDQYMTNTIFRNLLSNAIKFSNKGGGVKISARRIDEYVIEIAVSDSGIGMEPDVAESLFNFDGKYSTYGTFGEAGTGLGLSLCKEFAEKCGGGIEVESKFGVGTTFIVKMEQSKILLFD
jgi:signal transduction histidine kinase